MNPFTVLGIPTSSTLQEIRKAYRTKALATHPDRFPNDPLAAEKFHQLTIAYDILSDPQQRQKYMDDVQRREIHQHELQAAALKRSELRRKLEVKESQSVSYVPKEKRKHIEQPPVIPPSTSKLLVRVKLPVDSDITCNQVVQVLSRFGRVRSVQTFSSYIVLSFPNKTSLMLAKQAKLSIDGIPLRFEEIISNPLSDVSDNSLVSQLNEMTFEDLEELFLKMCRELR
ncbi:hypothetical protein GEMRC1_002726 [Eukaryota sp. GEM-RC1]